MKIIFVLTGIPQVLDRHLRGIGQCGHVEFEDRVLGKAIPWSTVLSSSLHACAVNTG